MTTVSRSNDPERKSLLTLPAEIRNSIYEFTLYIPTRSRALDITDTKNRAKIKAAFCLLCLCRQIREEARDIFGYINRLAINLSKTGRYHDDGRTCMVFMNQAPSLVLASITAFTVLRVPTAEHCTRAFRLLRKMRRLTSVRIELEPDDLWHRHLTQSDGRADRYIKSKAPLLRNAIVRLGGVQEVKLDIRHKYDARPPKDSAIAEFRDFEEKIQEVLDRRRA